MNGAVATATPLCCPHCARQLAAGARSCGSCGLPLPSFVALAPGQILAHGRYVVQYLLSVRGHVALATDRETFDRLVVIKALVDSAHFVDPRMLTELHHPSIPQIYSSFQDGPRYYLVGEYVEGAALSHGLTRPDPATGASIAGRAYEHEDVLGWGVTICRMLEYLSAQRMPLLHGDITPDAIILDSSSGEIRLVGFGAARAGTPGYAAPEQYAGAADPGSDVYALAATLYHLATDDDPRAHPFDFPCLARLGPFGVALGNALELNPARRLPAAELRRQLEVLIDDVPLPAIEAPDGAEIHDVAALAHWCESHWKAAGPWLAGALPEQVERLWGKLRLARDLRDLQAQHGADHNALLDAALALLDPHGFGAAAPLLSRDQRTIDFGRLAQGDRVTRQLMIWNSGRRYVGADVLLPHWIASAWPKPTLIPGQRVTFTYVVNLYGISAFGRLRDDILFQHHGRTLIEIDARVTVSRWRTFWRQYTGRIIMLAIACAVVLLLGRWGYWEAYKAWHYQAGVAALEGGDWAAARTETQRVLWAGSDDNSVWMLLKDSYYRAANDAVRARQWQQAAIEIVSLQAIDSGYRDLPALIRAYPELHRAVDSLHLTAWHSGDIRLVRSIVAAPANNVYSVRWSPDGARLALAVGNVSLWQMEESAKLRSFETDAGGVTNVAYSPDGRLLAAGSDRGVIYLWRADDGALLQRLERPASWVSTVAFSPDGRLLAAGSGGGKDTIALWRVSDGSLIRALPIDSGIQEVAFSPDGQILAAGSSDRSITLWRASDGALLRTIEQRQAIRSVTFSPDGQVLAAGDWAGNVKLWRVRDGKLMTTLSRHSSLVESIAFSPDGQTLASAGDKTIRLWRVRDGGLITEIEPGAGQVRSVAFSPDGQFLAAGCDWKENLKIWRAAP